MEQNYIVEKMNKLAALLRRLDAPRPMQRGFGGRAQTRALAEIALRDGITQRELMERLDIQPSSMSELMGKLESNGFIERTVSQEDRRLVNIHILEAGRQELERALMCADRFDPFEGLNEAEKDTLAALLDKGIRAATQECEKRGLPLNPPRPPFGCGPRPGHMPFPGGMPNPGMMPPRPFSGIRGDGRGCMPPRPPFAGHSRPPFGPVKLDETKENTEKI